MTEVPDLHTSAESDDDEWNDTREAHTEGFPRQAWPAYSAWVRAGDRSTKSVWPVVKAAFAAGVAAGRTRAAAELAEQFSATAEAEDEMSKQDDWDKSREIARWSAATWRAAARTAARITEGSAESPSKEDR